MAGFQPLRRRDDLFFDDADPTDDWMAQRNAWVAARDEAEAAGRDAWNDATRAGQNTPAPTSDDLVQLGARSWREEEAIAGGSQIPWQSARSDSAEDNAPVELIRPIQPDGPLRKLPNVGFATAKPGDSISRLLGTSDPVAIGRFMHLNGMTAARSNLQIGSTYAVPTAFDDASHDDLVAGQQAIAIDNARLATARARAEEMDRQAALIAAGRNMWTGELPGTQQPLAGRSAIARKPDTLWARRVAGLTGYGEGVINGLGRGAHHTTEGLAQAGALALRASNPVLDQVLPGPTAEEQLAYPAQRAALMVAEAVQHPRAALHQSWNRLNYELNPFDSPLPATAEEARNRSEYVGENHGEILFNAAAIPVGGELGATLEGLKYASEAGDVGKYLRAGHPLDVAEHLAQPYSGMDHHTWGRNRKLPSILGGGLLPEWLSESPLNRLHPRGIDRGQMHDLHYKVDPHFYGTKLPGRGKGGGWSGRRLGLEKYDPDGQFWNGVPGLTKGVVAGGVLDLGGDFNAISSQDQLP